MRNIFVTGLLATGTAAMTVPAVLSSVAPSTVAGSAGVQPTNTLVVANNRNWPLQDPTQALNALHAKAKATPSAVSFVPGVPTPAGYTPVPTAAQSPAESTDDHAKTMVADVGKAAAITKCKNPAFHREWSNASPANQQGWVNAINCLMHTPARSGLPGVQTRYDDLVAIHQGMVDTIHNVGQFLPWHRYMLKMLEHEMRSTCGYKGPMIWWDETKNAGNFQGAPMMNSQFFGAMPDGNAQCINNGAWGNHVCNIGPGNGNMPHCLSRGVDESLSAQCNQNYLNTCWSYTDYNDFQNCMFFGPHAYGHDAVGGDMSNVASSPNDPTFFIHHGFVDRAWKVWQRHAPASRTYAIGGYTTQNCGNNCQPTTLDYELTSFNFFPSVTVSQVMDTTNTYLCYVYDY